MKSTSRYLENFGPDFNIFQRSVCPEQLAALCVSLGSLARGGVASSVRGGMSINPHYVPGMGYKKHQPLPKLAGTLEQLTARVRCGDVELKLTLTSKLLARPLRDALVEPFLKVHNKRAATPLTWDDLGCIRVDGLPLDAIDVVAEAALKGDAARRGEPTRVELVPSAAVPQSALEGFLAVARPPPAAPYSRPLPGLTEELMRIVRAAAAAEHVDEDMRRRCVTAFGRVSAGAPAVSVAAVRAALLGDDDVRALGFPAHSPHGDAIDGALRRMATDRSRPTVDLEGFSALFAALSAAACAPPEAAIEEQSLVPHSARLTGNSFIDQLLDDDSVTVRPIA